MTAPIISFVTTVRHPSNSNDYSRVERYLKNTLRSVQSQICGNFQIIVVCNQIPDFYNDFPNVKFLKVDFPPPSGKNIPNTGMDAIRFDRGTKHAIALCHIKKTANSKFVMFFDADDLLSNRISNLITENSSAPGFFMEAGYIMKYGEKFLSLESGFYEINGNANIVKVADLPVPTDVLDITSSQDEILSALDDDFLHLELGSHQFVKSRMADRNIILEPVPFPGAIWVVGNFENHSDQFGQKGSMPTSMAHIAEFTIPADYLAADFKTKVTRFTLRLAKVIRKFTGQALRN